MQLFNQLSSFRFSGYEFKAYFNYFKKVIQNVFY